MTVLVDMPQEKVNPAPRTEPVGHPVLDVVIPVHNEEVALEASVRTVHDYLVQHFAYPFRITVADNASTDGTFQKACALARHLPSLRVVHLERKGRGRALNLDPPMAWVG